MRVLVLQNAPYELQSILVIKVENNGLVLFTIFLVYGRNSTFLSFLQIKSTTRLSPKA
jgi:hypothetical protein